MSVSPKPLVLIILDGVGHTEETQDNALHSAHTPTLDRLWQNNPHTLISASGLDVGLPGEQMGNSEVGHMNLGAGRIVYQELTRIDKAIAEGSFQNNPALTQAIDAAAGKGKAVHILGLLSEGGVHSHQQHILALCEMAAQRGAQHIYLHAFLDGRDTPPKSAAPSLQAAQDTFTRLGCGHIATLIGRYFAMDRDNRWERVQKAYELISTGHAAFEAPDAQSALEAAYARGESDEFVQATRIGDAVPVAEGDSLIFMNFRADRARELTRPFIEPNFAEFERKHMLKLASFTTLTPYSGSFAIPSAFIPEKLHNSLGEYLAQLGKTQLRIAETEKYAHVTFFFSGGREQPFPGEERILIPSPKVATYDLQPEMSAVAVTDQLTDAIIRQAYDLIVVNYANGDMVGHTGDFAAAVRAVECLDQCLGRIVAALEVVGGEALITADHGNVEQMRDSQTQQAHTAHTCGPVPLIYVGKRNLQLLEGGVLADIAPSLLQLLGLEQPTEMTGRKLVRL